MKPAVDLAQIAPLIFELRGQRVMLDSDLAKLYGVLTKNLNRAVSRNRDRFPDDFMFRLTAEEVENLRFQFGTSSSGHGGRYRYRPYAFTQEGIAMLSSVLRSERAVEVNVAIMRAFVRLRHMTLSVDELAQRVAELERGFGGHDGQIQAIFDALRDLMNPPEQPHREMGFHVREEPSPAKHQRRGRGK